MSYAIHLRKSRADLEAEARGEGESLARHRADLYALADRLGLEIGEEYCELISGDKLSERPEMQRLLDDVSAGRWEGVLDVEISRLTRGGLQDQGYILNVFKFSDTKIITPRHTYDLNDDWDEDNLTTEMHMSRREYKFITRRQQAGRNASATEGLWQSPVPLGYRKVKIPRGKGYTLEIDEEQARVVRMIYTMYADEEYGAARLARHLNSLGERTQRGNKWTTDAIRNIIRNPTYIGLVRWNRRVSRTSMIDGKPVTKRVRNDEKMILSKGVHPPIISEDLWQRAQAARVQRNTAPHRNQRPLQNPLAGIVKCAVCGRTMLRKDGSLAQGGHVNLLRCTTLDCPTVGTSAELVEQIVLQTLEQWSLTPEIDAQSAPKENSRQESIRAAQSHLERLRAQRARIFDAYEDGAYDAQEFIRRRSAKDEEITEAQATLDKLSEDLPLTPDEIIRRQLPQIRRVLDLYSLDLTPAERNALLRTVIEKIEYSKEKPGSRSEHPAKNLKLVITPKMPG